MIGTGDAYMIVKNLGSSEYSDEEKLEAIKCVFHTHRYYFAYKQDLWDIIEYLLERIDKENENNKS